MLPFFSYDRRRFLLPIGFFHILWAVMYRIDSYQATFLISAVLLVAFTSWHGWRMGLFRQVMNILALAAAYLIGYFGGGRLGPLLHRFIDLPERALSVLGAVAMGFVIYCCITLLGMIAFTKTSQQKPGLLRLGYGASGAICGGLYGLFLVWITVLAIRLLGSVAETQLSVAYHPRHIAAAGKAAATPTPQPQQPSAMIRTLAHMKESLEEGPTGVVVQQVDPIPGTLYGVLRKLGVMVSDEKSVDRFLSCPGVKPLLANPKIAALQNDPEIAREVAERNYFALVRNPRIIAAANDAEIAELMRKFEFEKALDYAIRRPEQDTAEMRQPGRAQ
ncbi:CvpA family protein [Chthoniobacter flavus]|nr:CvpA family protein [Chthoniobacter flavus]